MKSRIAKNMVWSITERLSSQIVYFIVSVFLARIIDPVDYGVVTTSTLLINILSGAIQSGFSSALIYKVSPTEEDYSTAFWCTLMMCTGLYGILFFLAPFFASFYGNSIITVYIRILAIQLILQGIHSIPFAYVSKSMDFRKNYVATIGGVFASSLIAIVLALNNLGVWALVVMTSVEVFVSATILWCITGIKIHFVLNPAVAKSMFQYCWKLMGVDVLNSTYSNINSFVIGRKYSTTEVAYYNRAYNIPQTLLGSANTAVSKVLFPAFAEHNEKGYILKNLRRSIKTINYIVYPMLIGLFAVSEELVLVLYTDKWASTIPYLRIMCLVWFFQPVQICAIQAFKAIGKSDEYFRLEIIKKVISVVLLIIGVAFSGSALILTYILVIGQLLSVFLNAPYLKKIFDYSFKEQLKDEISSVELCLIMVLGTYVFGIFFSDMLIRLIVKIAVGVILYLVFSMLTKNEQFFSLKNLFLEGEIKNETNN